MLRTPNWLSITRYRSVALKNLSETIFRRHSPDEKEGEENRLSSTNKRRGIETNRQAYVSIPLFINICQRYYFSIRIRASTANNPRSVATSGLISISFISEAKRSKVERRTIMSAYCCSSIPFCPRVPLIIG